LHLEKKYFFQAVHSKLISDMTQMEFNIRVSTLHQPLKNFALKLTRDTENAADLTQETITKAFYNRDKFRDLTIPKRSTTSTLIQAATIIRASER